ncbi:MAG: hypothetical protein ABIW76_18175 [Fibrobacteria bacterium]
MGEREEIERSSMSETTVQIIGVGLLILIVLFGIAKMKSPDKGSDTIGAVMEEIQKVLEPQVKQVREAKEKKNLEEKQNKKGDDKKSAA